MPASADHAARAAALQEFLLERIPPTRALALRVARYDGDTLALAAPLAANVNDKGCAFGGSLTSLLTLAGWGLIELALQARGFDCDVFVQDSEVRYLAPVWSDFEAAATLAEGESWDAFFSALAERGKARTRVACTVPGDGGAPAATLLARFVAKRRG